MCPLSLSLFSLVFGLCTAEPLVTRTCRSVHTKTLADHPQVWHETNENGSKMVLKMITKGEKTTSQSKWNKTIKMTRPSLWLIRSQILANKYMAMPAKPKPGTGKRHANHRQKWIWPEKNTINNFKNTRRFNQMWGIKKRLTKICVHCLRCFWMLDFVVLFVCLCMFCVLFVTVCHFGFWCFASPPFCTWGELEFLK